LFLNTFGNILVFLHAFSMLQIGGNVLLPVDTAGRVLELLKLLSDYWETKKLFNRCQLILLSTHGSSVLKEASQQLEFMSKSCRASFNETGVNPFQQIQKNIKLCYSLAG